jgi:N-formylglutamate amidohydrolase
MNIGPCYLQWLNEFNAIPPQPVFELCGTTHLVVTSVHGHEHFREGRVKPPDRQSHLFAYTLARALDASLLMVNQSLEMDSNHHTNTKFKQRLLHHCLDFSPRFLIDVHGMHACHPFDVCLGTLHGQSAKGAEATISNLTTRLEQHYFVVGDNEPFSGSGVDGGETMTRHSSEQLHLPSLQVEVSAGLLLEDTPFLLHRRCQLLAAFVETFNPHDAASES